MTVFTANKPEGEVFTDLPKDGVFYPAIQNKTQKFSNNAKLFVEYKFELPIPKDRTTIFANEEEEGNEETTTGGEKERRKTIDFIGTKRSEDM